VLLLLLFFIPAAIAIVISWRRTDRQVVVYPEGTTATCRYSSWVLVMRMEITGGVDQHE